MSGLLKNLEIMEDKKSDEVRNNIMGIEGQASAEYWAALTHVIDDKWGFEYRS